MGIIKKQNTEIYKEEQQGKQQKTKHRKIKNSTL
jgi:hypothetical protein